MTIPADDLAEFSSLAQDVRGEVYEWLRLLRPALAHRRGLESGSRRGIGDTLARVASHIGCSPETARRKYDLFRKSGDWRVFINRSKARPGAISIPAPIIDEFKRLAEQNQRKSAPAWRKMKRLWESGQLDHLPWPELADNGLPRGCSYRNMIRLLNEFELKAMRQGLGAALADHGPQFLSTRVGLYVGSHISIDDLLRDIEAVWIKGNQRVRIQEMGAHDFFSGLRFASHRRPQFIRESDGRRDSIKERETRYFLAGIFRGIGYSPRGTVMLSELGTAAIRDPLAHWLLEQTNSCVTRRQAGITGAEQILLYGRGGGNPRHKARLESSHNLLHNETGDIQTATGHDRTPPEWLTGYQEITDAALKLMRELPPEQAAELCIPHPEYWQLCRFLAGIDMRIAASHDHNLEGWEELGFTTVEYRRSLIGSDADDPSSWITPLELMQLPGPARAQIIQAAELLPYLRRPRKLSRQEVFSRGATGLVTLPDHVIALMFCDRNLGDDLREKKRLNANRVFDVSDACAEAGRMYFEPYAIEPDGSRRALADRVEYGVVINPFDRDRLWIYDARGGYIGTSPRRDRVSPLDEGGIRRRLGQIEHDRAQMLKPLRERHADAAGMIAEVQEHNRRVAEGQPATPEAIAKARAATRLDAKAAAAGAALMPVRPAEDIEIVRL